MGGAASLGAALAVMTACSGPVDVDSVDAGSGTAACEKLVDDLPDNVVDLDRREVDPDNGLSAAWGDPSIVLRCGVERPAGLVPTSFCFVVNDVGWYAEDEAGPLDGTSQPTGSVVFTTIGRSPYVEMTVPEAEDRSPVDPLTDVATAVQAHTQVDQPCQ